MQKRKTALFAILTLAVIAFLSVGATLAALTDKDDVTLSYHIGNVSVSLEEPKWESPENKNYFETIDEENPNNNRAFLVPGRIFDKDPYVVIDKGSEDCYVRVKVTINQSLAKVIEVPEVSTGWSRSKVSENVYYYTYADPLSNSGNYLRTKTPAFSQVKVLGDADADDLSEVDKEASIDVVAQAIQTAGFGSAEAAFKVWDDYVAA